MGSAETAAERAVKQIVRSMNRAWLEGRIEDLGVLFHDRVVAVSPGATARLVGREAMLESFRQFTEHARTESFEEQRLDVDVFADTAVATLRFRIRYAISDRSFDEAGNEILVLTRGDAGWQIAWRMQVPAGPERGADA